MDCSGRRGELPRSRLISRVSAEVLHVRTSPSGKRSFLAQGSHPHPGGCLVTARSHKPSPSACVGDISEGPFRIRSCRRRQPWLSLQPNHSRTFSSAESYFLQPFPTRPDTASSRASSVNLLCMCGSPRLEVSFPGLQDLCTH